MMRVSYVIVVVAALAGCTIAPPDLSSKGCPCVEGFTCEIESNQCSQIGSPPIPSVGCVVYTDGKLYCGNKSSIDMFRQPATSSEVINRLLSTYSWFECWSTGELHAGGSTTWYFTDGDIRGSPFGWLPSVDVNAPSAFDADPVAYGFQRCH